MGTTTTKTKISNGLLEIQQLLLELTLQENNFKAELQRVAEERTALEHRLSIWPPEAPPAEKAPPQQHARKPKAKAKSARAAKPSGRGATVDVLEVLRENRSDGPLSVQDIKARLPGLTGGSVHQALSVLKKRGRAKNPGIGKWVYAG